MSGRSKTHTVMGSTSAYSFCIGSTHTPGGLDIRIYYVNKSTAAPSSRALLFVFIIPVKNLRYSYAFANLAAYIQIPRQKYANICIHFMFKYATSELFVRLNLETENTYTI